MITSKAIVSGKVQGVGFRYFVKNHADKLGVKGYAKNLDDGRVEVLVQGDAEAVKSMLEQLHIGPQYSRVTSVDSSEIMNRPLLSSFTIS